MNARSDGTAATTLTGAALRTVHAEHGGTTALGDHDDEDVFDPFTVPAIAESTEMVVEEIDAGRVAAPALLEGLRLCARTTRAPTTTGTSTAPSALTGEPLHEHDVADPTAGRVAARRSARSTGSFADHARAILYNGVGHHRAAQASALRACEHDDFELLEWALAELVEASARSGSHGVGMDALRRLEVRALAEGSDWALGLVAWCRAVLGDDEAAEVHHLEATARLRASDARVALGRAHLLYGEWLRRRGRRLDAREHLDMAQRMLRVCGMGGFADRARRELLATSEPVRRRTDDTTRDLTPQEAQIARLAAAGCTNPEIAGQLYISPRTVEWHLRKVFTKLDISSRRELPGVAHRSTSLDPGWRR